MMTITSLENKIELLYHKGQKNIWNGKEYLQECLDKHGDVKVSDEHAKVLKNIFGIILWGELAAWKISSALSFQLEDDEARMAATSQAHDEARHYYVMKDYLELLGEVPSVIDPHADEFLNSILNADNTAKMLLGMQLMVEPLALTLFKVVREKNIDPILSDLLIMYEKDEARHVALGTLYLPKVLATMSPVQKVELLVWQFFGYMKQFEMLRSLKDDFIALGISPRHVFAIARKKQLKAIELLSEEMGEKYPFTGVMLKVIDFRNEMNFPEQESGYFDKIRNAVKSAVN
jgi:demethoxyubiquinone hydroxylase (CLK1/Coq7/Cat5 family)